jgi:hypothetical protein
MPKIRIRAPGETRGEPAQSLFELAADVIARALQNLPAGYEQQVEGRERHAVPARPEGFAQAAPHAVALDGAAQLAADHDAQPVPRAVVRPRHKLEQRARKPQPALQQALELAGRVQPVGRP